MTLRATSSVSRSLRSTKLSERSVKVYASFNLSMCSGVSLLSFSKRLVGIDRYPKPHAPLHGRNQLDLRVLDELSTDEEGTDLASIGDVQDEAAYALTDLLREQVRATDGSPFAQYLAIEVRDSSGPLFEATFSFETKRTIQ
jgi:uncharacterized protein DUF6894